MKPLLKTVIILFLIAISLTAQEKPEYFSEYRTIIPAKSYEATELYKFFFGEHWRKLWTSPVKVGVLDLDKFAGGIKPTKKGGGFQTKSLRFVTKEGVQYKFRSLDKDPKKVLPLELQETVAADLMQDQISSSNPYAPLIAVPMLNAVGILQAAPLLCILPDDEKLGEFREEFGGMAGMIEEHPDVWENNKEGFAGAEKVESTFDLFEKLEKGNKYKVDYTGYLKARLTDMFLGDWDRHTDQWRWGLIESSSGEKKWNPIPRDRDQAFAKYDGLFPYLFARAVTQIEDFSEDYNKVESLTWSGRYIDRRFLSMVSKSEWDSVTSYVKRKLTDSVITAGVKKLPGELFDIAGRQLISDLISRRDQLDVVSKEFYHLIMKYVDIHLSKDDEYVEVIRENDSTISVQCFKIKKEKNREEPFYSKRFYTDETKEIRIMLKDGDDKAVVRGVVDNSSLVIIAGDEGKDVFIDSSRVNGYLFCFLPISNAENQTEFFDGGNKSTFIEGAGTFINTDDYFYPSEQAERYEPPTRDWGHDWRFGAWLDVNPDDGVLAGTGPILYKFGFRTVPYVYRAELTAAYSYFPGTFKLRFLGRFYKIVPEIPINVEILTSGMEISNYYGPGNETFSDADLEEEGYFKARMQVYYSRLTTEIDIYRRMVLLLGTEFRYTDPDEFRNFADSSNYGYNDLFTTGIEAGIRYSSLDNDIFPTSGIFYEGRYSFNGGWSKTSATYSKIYSELRAYFPLPLSDYSLFAFKISGQANRGTYPFFESAFIGGSRMLRSFEKNRYGGDSYLLINNELRIHLFKFDLFVPYDVGFSVSNDLGRVFLKGEYSKRWHTGSCLGIWIFPINKEYVVSMDVSFAKTGTDFYLRTGFMF